MVTALLLSKIFGNTFFFNSNRSELRRRLKARIHLETNYIKLNLKLKQYLFNYVTNVSTVYVSIVLLLFLTIQNIVLIFYEGNKLFDKLCVYCSGANIKSLLYFYVNFPGFLTNSIRLDINHLFKIIQNNQTLRFFFTNKNVKSGKKWFKYFKTTA